MKNLKQIKKNLNSMINDEQVLAVVADKLIAEGAICRKR